WATVTLAAAVLSVAVAAAARWNRLDSRDVGLEVVALAAGTVHGLAAVVAAVDESSEFVLSAVLVGLGAVLLAYATLPGRLGFAYVGVGALTSALWVQLVEHDVAVEWYVLPPALMLLGIGAVQWARTRDHSTWVTRAPAITVGLFPPLVVALAGDSLVRLVIVTAVSALLLVGGIAQRWQAPVVLGALALVLVAWTQGGPWLAYVDGWI